MSGLRPKEKYSLKLRGTAYLPKKKPKKIKMDWRKIHRQKVHHLEKSLEEAFSGK